MSETKAGMLPGDEFSLEEWFAAKGKPRTSPVELPESVKQAYNELLTACQHAGVPHVAIFALNGGIGVHYDILDKPENVHGDILTARATASGDINHQIALMGIALQGLDISKLKGV